MFRHVLRACTFLTVGLGPLLTIAQVGTSVVRGTVLDERNGQQLAAVRIEVITRDSTFTGATDGQGNFHVDGVPVGIHALRLSLNGYETLLVPELWVRAGKQEQLELKLSVEISTLQEAEVVAVRRTEATGMLAITVEQSLRYPAMFFDPARVAGSAAAVGTANDQANHLTIRGNSPNANAWLLEGAEMVNANHLSNAGTQTDLPTLSGGGVNILSAQMLGNSHLLTGNLPMDRGNAVGGIMDMNLRPGSNAEQEWTVQAGLIGIDVATEGPFSKGKRGSYLANYRYSTLGLLSAAGVELGDEAISFQDLSLHVTLPFGQRGEVRVFGLGGTSTNVFKADNDTSTWEYDKDSSDITYTARTGAAGACVKLPIGGRGTLRTTILLSATEQEREQINYNTDRSEVWRGTDRLAEQKLSVVAAYDGMAGARFRYTLGGSAMERNLTNVLEEDVTGWLLRPYANGRWSATEHLQLSFGLGYAQYTFNNSNALEPRAAAQWRMLKDRRITLSYGWRSMLPWQQVMLVRFNGNAAWNEHIGLSRSEDIVLAYDHPFNERVTLHVEGYQQQLRDLGIPDPRMNWGDGFSTGHLVNAWDAPVYQQLLATGKATNTGLEVTLAHTFAKGYFYQVNGTVYNSEYELSGIATNTRWNGNYRANLMGGAEWARTKEGRVRTWGVSGRLAVAGGLRYTPIIAEPRGFYYYGAPWSAQLSDFFRIDLRVYLKRDRQGRTGMWAVDLQNLTNTRNEAYVYYDHRKDAVITKYQLGLIPNLSYRIEF